MIKRKFSILIVDDNVNFVTRLVSLLNEIENVSIINLAYSYDEAATLLIEEPDLVLLDINLPGKNGMSLLKKIKESANNCEVIMITNFTGEYYRRECKRMGALLFLDKTNDFDQVPDIIKTLRN